MLPPPRFGQTFGRPISLDHRCTSIFMGKCRAANLKSDEDRELEIIHDLTEKVLPFSEAISEACDICAELDCLLCFAEASNLYNYRRPQMSEENVINIKQGRCVLVSYNRCGPEAYIISTGTHCKNKPLTHSCQMTSSWSAERALISTRMFMAKMTTSCLMEVYWEIAYSFARARMRAER
jgi:hypothetical protein